MILLAIFLLNYIVSSNLYTIIKCDKESNSALFNICLQKAGDPSSNKIRTTFSDSGYYMLLKVNNYNLNVTNFSGTFQEIEFNTVLQEVDKSISIIHTFNNTGTTTKKISFVIHTDSQLENNDAVPLYILPNMQGIRLFYGEKLMDIVYHQNGNNPPLDSIWVGKYNNRFNNFWKNSTSYFTNGVDSGFAMSIQNREILPNSQLQFIGFFEPNELPTKIFTPSAKFSPSLYFTKTEYFTQTDLFTLTDIFSDSFSFIPTPTESIVGQKEIQSKTLTLSYLLVKTVAYKDDFQLTRCSVYYSSSFFESFCNTSIQVPYIIYSYSQTAVQTEYLFYTIVKKKKINQAQLIGIVCGSVAVLFTIIGIIVFIINRENILNEVSETDCSIQNNDDSDHQAQETNNQVSVVIDNSVNPTNENNMDLWI